MCERGRKRERKCVRERKPPVSPERERERVCVCVREREEGREGGREREGGEREKEPPN